MKHTESAIDIINSIFKNQKCSSEALCWLSVIMQNVIDLGSFDPVIKQEAWDWLKSKDFKHVISLLGLEFDSLGHCFTDKYLKHYVKNAKRREKYISDKGK